MYSLSCVQEMKYSTF